MLYIDVAVSGVAPHWWEAGVLPVGYRPQRTFYLPACTDGENSDAELWVGTSGSVQLISDQKNASTTCRTVAALPLW